MYTNRCKIIAWWSVEKLAPYSYIKDPKDKHKFLIDKNVSHIVRKIFDMILDENNTVGKTDVDNFLNEARMIENGSDK